MASTWHTLRAQSAELPSASLLERSSLGALSARSASTRCQCSTCQRARTRTDDATTHLPTTAILPNMATPCINDSRLNTETPCINDSRLNMVTSRVNGSRLIMVRQFFFQLHIRSLSADMAAKARRPAKDCKILAWLERRDAELASAFKQLCVEGILNAGGRYSGVTFLYPEDAAYRAEIVDHAFGADTDKAERMIRALVLPVFLGKAADWKAAAVGNLLGVKFNVTKAAAGAVETKEGLALAESDFNAQKKRETELAVWLIKSGRAPEEGGGFTATPIKREKGAAAGPAKTGAGEAAAASVRGDTAAEAAKNYVTAMTARKKAGAQAVTEEPYIAAAANFLDWLKREHEEHMPMAHAIIDNNAFATFYMIFEPYRTANHWFSDELLAEWARACREGGAANGPRAAMNVGAGDALARYRAHLDAARAANGAAAKALAEALDSLAADFGAGTPAKTAALFAEIESSNKVGGVKAYPDAVAAEYRKRPGQNYWHAAVRFAVAQLCTPFHRPNPSAFDAEAFAESTAFLRSCLPGADLATEASFSCRRGEVDVDKRFWLWLNMCFLGFHAGSEITGGDEGAADDIFEGGAVVGANAFADVYGAYE
jgi:hypothetical protein